MQLELNRKTLLLAFALTFVVYAILQLGVFHAITEYDHDRDLIIEQELVERGTFSYFGQAYVINPPINYITHAVPIWLTGDLSYLAQQIIEIIMFAAAIILIYFIALELTKDQKQAFIAFVLAAVSWTFILATAIRSYSIMLLMGTLLFYTYLRYLSKPGYKSAAIFGIVIGLAMLTKSSFFFLLVIMGVHLIWTLLTKQDYKYEHLGAIAILTLVLYAPYLYYIFINGLPWPWQANLASLSGAWAAGAERIPIWHIYIEMLKTWPVLFAAGLVAIGLQIRSEKKSVLMSTNFLLILTVLVTPLLVPLLLRLTALNHWFFLFIPLPILAAQLVTKLEKHSKLLLVLLLVAIAVTGAYQISKNVSSEAVNGNEELNNFISELSASDSLLSEWRYAYFNVFSDAYAEYSQGFDPGNAVVYAIDYYISAEPIEDAPFLEPYKQMSSKTPVYGGDFYAYKVDLPVLLELGNFTSNGKILLTSSDDKPVSFARCSIYTEDWNLPQISNNAGEIENIVPQGFSGEAKLRCVAMGYQQYDGAISETINLGELNGFRHNYKDTRF